MCKVSEGLKVRTVLRFENNGQDFLEWHLDVNDKIVDVKPGCQKSVWVGKIVLDYQEGERPIYEDETTEKANQLIHKVEEVKQVVTCK